MRAFVPFIWGLTVLSCTASDPPSTSGAGMAVDPGLEAEIRIDGLTENLVPIGMMAVTGDGTMILSQGQDASVRFFDANGAALGSFGGSGEGPGEFRFLTRLGFHRDTLWVFDSQLARFTLISADRQLVRTIRAPTRGTPADADRGRIPEFPLAIPIALPASGGFHAYLSPVVGQEVPDRFRNVSVYGVVTEAGIIERIVAMMRSDPNCCVRAEGQRGTSTASVPLTNRSRYVASADGRLGILAEEPQGADGASIAVTVLRVEGDTVFSRRYDVTRVPVSDAVRDSLMRSRIEQLEQSSPELARAFRTQATIPASYPPVADLIAGRDGTVWIEVPVAAAGERRYLVLAPDGEPAGTIRLPFNSRISVAELNRIWVLERDENDVQSVVRYRVSW